MSQISRRPNVSMAEVKIHEGSKPAQPCTHYKKETNYFSTFHLNFDCFNPYVFNWTATPTIKKDFSAIIKQTIKLF
jgi:hypothetical protein